MVKILNTWDSQGNQVAHQDYCYPALRGCGGAGYQAGYVMTELDDIIFEDEESREAFMMLRNLYNSMWVESGCHPTRNLYPLMKAIMALREIGRVKAERDKAVSELKELASCKSCKHNACSAHDEPCLGCEWQNDKPNWEWRGVQNETN